MPDSQQPSATGPYVCPSPCDDDCEALCHECHQITWKREHDVAACEMTVRLHRNPAYLAAVEQVEREIEADRRAGRAPNAVDLNEMFARYRAARATNQAAGNAPGGASTTKLRTVPTTLRDANAFVAEHHRHHKPVRGHTSSTAVCDEQGQVRGVAIIGRPPARKIDHRQVCEVLRVATDGCANACSALYGACCRIAKACGYAHVITYTLNTEPGTSLRAAGWKPVAITDGGSWSRAGRERDDAHPLIPKVRWECRCSSAPVVAVAA